MNNLFRYAINKVQLQMVKSAIICILAHKINHREKNTIHMHDDMMVGSWLVVTKCETAHLSVLLPNCKIFGIRAKKKHFIPGENECSNKLVVLNGWKTMRKNSGQMIHDDSNNSFFLQTTQNSILVHATNKIHYHLFSQYITVCEECCCLSWFFKVNRQRCRFFYLFFFADKCNICVFCEDSNTKRCMKTICSLSVFLLKSSEADTS